MPWPNVRRVGAARGQARAWERFSAAPAPMGFDPAPIWPDGPESEGFAALRLDPWRVQVRSAAATAAGEPYASWTPASTGP